MEPKAILGGEADWRWNAPCAVDPASVSLAIQREDGTVWVGGPGAPLGFPVVTFEPAREAVAVEAIDASRRVLTLASGVSGDVGLAREWGAARLITAHDGIFDVLVARMSTTEVHLAEPMPAGVAVGVSPLAASLQWSRWTAALGAANVTGVLGRDYTTTVYFTPRTGSMTTGRQRTSSGSLCVVTLPFDPGGTGEGMAALEQRLASGIGSRQQGWGPQLAAALDELVALIREQTGQMGLWEDDLPGASFRGVQERLAVAIALASAEPTTSDRYRERALELFAAVMRRTLTEAEGRFTAPVRAHGGPLMTGVTRERADGRPPYSVGEPH